MQAKAICGSTTGHLRIQLTATTMIQRRHSTLNTTTRKRRQPPGQRGFLLPRISTGGEDLTIRALESITHRGRAKGVTDLDTVQSSSCFSPPPTRSIAAAAVSLRRQSDDTAGGSNDGCARGREDTTGVSLRRPAAAGERRDGNGMGRGLPALNGAQLILNVTCGIFSFLYLKI